MASALFSFLSSLTFFFMLFLLLCCGCELHVTAGLFVVVVAVDVGFFFFGRSAFNSPFLHFRYGGFAFLVRTYK